MKEELIRVDNGHFLSEGSDYQFDIFIARGECIGIYVDEHLTSGTAYLDIFKGYSSMAGGAAFCCGDRVGAVELKRWILQNSMIVDKNRFDSKELTAQDFLLALARPMGRLQKKQAVQRLHAPETIQMAEQMGLTFPRERKLSALSMLDYFRLAVFRAWFWSCQLVVLDRLTETLRRRDMDQLMHCVQLLLGQGTAAFLFDMDEEFLYRYANRVDVVKNRKTFYRLCPEEYDGRLYEILGWERRNNSAARPTPQHYGDKVMLTVTGLTFPAMPPLSFQIRSGEIAFLRDENYNTVSRIRDCFLGEQRWLSGIFCLDGRVYEHAERRADRTSGPSRRRAVRQPDRTGQFEHLPASQGWTAHRPPQSHGKHSKRSLPVVRPRGAAAPAQCMAAARTAAFFLFQMVFPQPAAADLFFPLYRSGVRLPRNDH